MALATAGVDSVEIGSAGLNRWWRVVGGLSMNLALGTLYAWSVFVAPLEKQFGWKRADTSMVFTIAVVVFALTFVVADASRTRSAPSMFSGRRRAGEPGLFLCSYTTSLTYLLHLLRRDRRLGQRLRLCHAHSGDGQVVPR